MNSNQTSLRIESQTGLSPLGTMRIFVRNNLVGTIATTIAGSLLLTGVSTYNIWHIYNSFQSNVSKQFELRKISDDLIYQDEFLTMSAKMSASTGDIQWQERYNKMIPLADDTLKKLRDNISEELLVEAKNSDAASSKLIVMESESFKLVKAGKQKEAAQVLMGAEYINQKKIFSDANIKVLAKVDQLIDQELKDYQQQLLLSICIAGITLPVLIGAWLLVLAAVRDYIQDRRTALLEIAEAQKSLISLDDARQREAELYQQQEAVLREAQEVLEQDIEELLDVVCEIEAGDFTVQARVNERATGLIGDTLNRLVESLGGVLSQVCVSAEKVSVNSSNQAKIAAAVVQNTTEQSESVIQVLALMETVRQSANTAAKQLQETSESMVILQTAVITGETTIGSLDREIDVLQQGSDRIVQQMKTLGEFVGLSDRFVEDHTDIATQTQILALNASLVAARAAEQRDPKEFESVAREFESIASQVSQLAQKTNDGLNSLEQRNTQINRVVSDVDGEVQRLGSLVDSFTQGVKHTREVFATVESVTQKAVADSDVVFQTSQTIIESADSTAKSISAIAILATKIDRESQSARSISNQMSDLSTQLLNKIQVFKLPTGEVLVISAPVPEILTSESDGSSIAMNRDYQLN